MSAWIESINDFSSAWATWMWRATWQATIVVSAAWLLCFILRRWSPQLRSWIWRLAYLKLLLLLVWTTPVTLAVLPAASQQSGVSSQESAHSPSVAVGRHASEVGHQVSAVRGEKSGTDHRESAVRGQESATGEQEPQKGDDRTPILAAAPPSPVDNSLGTVNPSISFAFYLSVLWACGAIAVVCWLVVEIRKAIKLYRSVRLIDRPELAELVNEVRQRLGLRCGVCVGESQFAGGPMLIKFIRPVVVFPPGLLHTPSPQPSHVEGEGAAPDTWRLAPDTRSSLQPFTPSYSLSDNDIRLVLAHELAHVKRHDLAWNALAAFVHCLLYFHPLVWLAHRFARQEQEMACDELVVTRLNVERHEYGKLLVKIVHQVAGKFSSTVATAAMSKSYQTLSRRLTAMQRIRQLTHRQIIFAAIAFGLLGAIGIVPWCVVAQESKPGVLAPTAKPDDSKGVSLAEAVKQFNAEAAKDRFGKSQPPLTENEVLTAIRGWDRSSTPASDDVFATYQTIAETGQLPAGSKLRFTTRWTTDRLDFDVWWIDLDVETGPKQGYTFRIRDRKLASRPLADNLVAEHAETPVDSKKSADPGETDSDLEKRLVGTWRDPAGKRVVFFKDGTYDDLGVNIFVHIGHSQDGKNSAPETYRNRGQGTWKLHSGILQLTNDSDASFWSAERKSANTSDAKFPEGTEFRILRLDDSFLRMTFSPLKDKDTYFLRRVEEKPVDERFAAVPAELRPFFDAALFTPEEAEALVELFEVNKIDTASLQTIERIQQAQRRKITLQQLFGMTPEEVAAFQQLLVQHTGSRETLVQLAEGGQLSPVEQSAYKKTEPFSSVFETLATNVPIGTGFFRGGNMNSDAQYFRQNNSREAFGRPSTAPGFRRQREVSLTETQSAAVEKLFAYLYNLQNWYRSAVFHGHH